MIGTYTKIGKEICIMSETMQKTHPLKKPIYEQKSETAHNLFLLSKCVL